jgi:hypothetical protein
LRAFWREAADWAARALGEIGLSEANTLRTS